MIFKVKCSVCPYKGNQEGWNPDTNYCPKCKSKLWEDRGDRESEPEAFHNKGLELDEIEKNIKESKGV